MKIDADVMRSLRRIVEYMNDECTHWEEEGQPEDHIWRDVISVVRFLKEQEPKMCRCCGATDAGWVESDLCVGCEYCGEEEEEPEEDDDEEEGE